MTEKSRAATIALIAEFIGSITGTRPPSEAHLFPAEWQPALDTLISGLEQIAQERREAEGW